MSTDPTKYSIIIPTFNNFNYLQECLQYIEKYNEKKTEVIIVDNASTDTTKDYLKEIEGLFTVVRLSKNCGFGKAVNEGIKVAKGKWIVVLNNDVLVTKGWLRKLESGAETYKQRSGTKQASIMVPTSNYVGMQAQQQPGDRGNFEQVAEQVYRDKYKQIVPVGIASGMLMMINREVFDKIGTFDEMFFAGCEDVDFCARAYLAGFVTVACQDTFVFHYGSKTLDKFPTFNRGTAQLPDLLGKYSFRRTTKQKLGVIYRVKIRDAYEADVFIRSLNKSQTFADHIFILDDDSVYPVAKEGDTLTVRCPDGVKGLDLGAHITECDITLQNHVRKFDERRDRNDLLAMAKEAGMDWVFSLDADEIVEDKVDRKYMERLINTPDPTAHAYSVHYYTFWNDEKHYNSGDVWKTMCGNRIVRLTDDPRIFLGAKSTFHVGNVPYVPADFSRTSTIRIKHFGYVKPEQRQRKYEWYEKVDFDKDPLLIGHEDYKHLIDENPIVLRSWIEDNTISICTIMKNEQARLFDYLRMYSSFADELVLVDTGSTDKSIWMAELFGCKVVKREWDDSFSAARNAALDVATGDWILHLDIDEHIQDLGTIKRMTDVSDKTSGYMFYVNNLMKNNTYSISETVRLFRTKYNYRYSGYVHETIEKDPKLQVMRSPVPIYHYGYLKDDKELKDKMKYYFKLNQKQIEDFPNDPRPRYAMAIHYLEENFADKAEEGLLKAIELERDFYQAHKDLAYLYLARSLAGFEKVLTILPQQHPMHNYANNNVQVIKDMIGHQSRVAPGHLSELVEPSNGKAGNNGS